MAPANQLRLALGPANVATAGPTRKGNSAWTSTARKATTRSWRSWSFPHSLRYSVRQPCAHTSGLPPLLQARGCGCTCAAASNLPTTPLFSTQEGSSTPVPVLEQAQAEELVVVVTHQHREPVRSLRLTKSSSKSHPLRLLPITSKSGPLRLPLNSSIISVSLSLGCFSRSVSKSHLLHLLHSSEPVCLRHHLGRRP